MTSSEKIFPNTFAPHVKNNTMPVGAVIALLRVGGIRYNSLPKEVKQAVAEEISKTKRSRKTK